MKYYFTVFKADMAFLYTSEKMNKLIVFVVAISLGFSAVQPVHAEVFKCQIAELCLAGGSCTQQSPVEVSVEIDGKRAIRKSSEMPSVPIEMDVISKVDLSQYSTRSPLIFTLFRANADDGSSSVITVDNLGGFVQVDIALGKRAIHVSNGECEILNKNGK